MLSSENSNLPWGARSGVLFDNSTFDNDTSARQADVASLLCSWDTTKICPWQARGGLSTFYIWETGENDWQKLSLLESGGTPVKFDPPMLVKYTHPTTSTTSATSSTVVASSLYSKNSNLTSSSTWRRRRSMAFHGAARITPTRPILPAPSTS